MKHVARLGITGEHAEKFYQICFVLVCKRCLAFEETLIWIWGISVFQRGVLSSTVSLCFSLLQGQAVGERGFCVWGEDNGLKPCCTGPFLLQTGGTVWIKQIVIGKKNITFVHLYCEPQLPGYVSFGNAYFGMKSSGFRTQFYKCEMVSWMQWL